MDVPAILKRARRQAMLSQAELAQRVGVTRSLVADYETGRHSPSVRQLERLLAAAGLQLAVELEPLGADLDAEIRRCLALPLAERLRALPFQLEHLVTLLDGVPYVIEGSAAALVQGAPVPVKAVDIMVADSDQALERLARAIGECGYLRFWDVSEKRWEMVYPTPSTFRDTGPTTHWYVIFGEARIRLVDPCEATAKVHVDVEGMHLPVVGLWQLETTDERVRSVLVRTRELVGSIDVDG